MTKVIGIETNIADVVASAERLEGGLNERNILSVLDDTRTGEVLEFAQHFDINASRSFSDMLRGIAAAILVYEEDRRAANREKKAAVRKEIAESLFSLIQGGAVLGFDSLSKPGLRRYIQVNGAAEIVLCGDGVPALKRFPLSNEGLLEALKVLKER